MACCFDDVVRLFTALNLNGCFIFNAVNHRFTLFELCNNLTNRTRYCLTIVEKKLKFLQAAKVRKTR